MPNTSTSHIWHDRHFQRKFYMDKYISQLANFNLWNIFKAWINSENTDTNNYPLPENHLRWLIFIWNMRATWRYRVCLWGNNLASITDWDKFIIRFERTLVFFFVFSVTTSSWHSKWFIFQSKTKTNNRIANKIIQRQE